MPITYSVKPSEAVVRSVFSGHIRRQEIDDYFDGIAANPAYQPSFDRLIDWRELDDVSRADVTRLAQLIKASARSSDSAVGRRALVVRHDWQYGVGRMLQIMLGVTASPVSLELFHEPSDAEAWLDRKRP